MIADGNIKTYYLHFKSSAEKSKITYKEKLKEILLLKEELRNYVIENKNALFETYNIDLDSYEDWVNNSYETSELLYKQCMKLLRVDESGEHRIVLIQTAKYCNILRNEYKIYKLIESCDKRINVTYKKYREYVTKYFSKVHACILRGEGYKFDKGIGIYICNYWKIDDKLRKKIKKLDFDATNARKRELIAKGLKPYDDKEAVWYKARHIPYDGVEYRVYKDDSYFYDFTFVCSSLFTNYSLEYDRTEYINVKYRKLGYRELADKFCRTFEDIVNLQVDIKVKLNILLHKNPTKYINFVRNAERQKYTT